MTIAEKTTGQSSSWEEDVAPEAPKRNRQAQLAGRKITLRRQRKRTRSSQDRNRSQSLERSSTKSFASRMTCRCVKVTIKTMFSTMKSLNGSRHKCTQSSLEPPPRAPKRAHGVHKEQQTPYSHKEENATQNDFWRYVTKCHTTTSAAQTHPWRRLVKLTAKS